MSRHTFEITLNNETGPMLVLALDQFLIDEKMRSLGGEVATDEETVEFAKRLRATVKEELVK